MFSASALSNYALCIVMVLDVIALLTFSIRYVFQSAFLALIPVFCYFVVPSFVPQLAGVFCSPRGAFTFAVFPSVFSSVLSINPFALELSVDRRSFFRLCQAPPSQNDYLTKMIPRLRDIPHAGIHHPHLLFSF